jgi:hypothetical protein
MSLLPPRPWHLKSGFTIKRSLLTLALLIGSVTIGGGYGVWQWGSAQKILEDSRLWKEGDVQTPADASGRVKTNKFIFNGYDLQVSFADEDDVEHTYKVEFDTLGSTVDENAEVSVRYMKGHPERFALSWAVDVTGGRWASFAFMFGVGVLGFGGGLLYAAWITLRRTREIRAAVESGDEIECEIVSVTPQIVNGRASGNLIYRYRVPEQLGAPPGFEGEEIVNPKKGLPILLDGEKKLLALGTTQAPKAPLVLRADLSPLAVDEMVRLQVLEQVARRA